MEHQSEEAQAYYERYQQLLWERCCQVAANAAPDNEAHQRIKALRTQIIDYTRTLCPDIDETNGVVDIRVRGNLALDGMRYRMLNLLNLHDPVTRRMIQRYVRYAPKPV